MAKQSFNFWKAVTSRLMAQSEVKYSTVEINGVTLYYDTLEVGQPIWVVVDGNTDKGTPPEDGTYQIEGKNVTVVGGLITEITDIEDGPVTTTDAVQAVSDMAKAAAKGDPGEIASKGITLKEVVEGLIEQLSTVYNKVEDMDKRYSKLESEHAEVLKFKKQVEESGKSQGNAHSYANSENPGGVRESSKIKYHIG